MTARTPTLRLGPGGREELDDAVVTEAPLELRIGGKALTVIMRTPGHDEELARGFLYTEGLIETPADLAALVRPEGLVGDEVGNVLDVTLRPGARAALPAGERTFYASSSCGVCGKNAISALRLRGEAVHSSFTIAAATLVRLPAAMRPAQPLFGATGGAHAAALFTSDGTLLQLREDVGRHNAVDKVLGWALAAGRVPLTEALLLVSGRTSYEILQKAIAVGLPLVAAVGAPTSLAVDLAAQYGVTLAGFLREGGMNLYVCPERVTLTDTL